MYVDKISKCESLFLPLPPLFLCCRLIALVEGGGRATWIKPINQTVLREGPLFTFSLQESHGNWRPLLPWQLWNRQQTWAPHNLIHCTIKIRVFLAFHLYLIIATKWAKCCVVSCLYFFAVVFYYPSSLPLGSVFTLPLVFPFPQPPLSRFLSVSASPLLRCLQLSATPIIIFHRIT